MVSAYQYIGQVVTATMDRPLGSKHPKHGFIYEVNYGFVPGVISGDGEELDVYVLGVKEALQNFTGRCIAVVHRTNDDDDKLIVVPEGMILPNDEIEAAIAFQEKWFAHILVRKIPEIHLICGFMGFGKTTYAKGLEKELPAIRYTHDDLMFERYGRTPDNFATQYAEVDAYILEQAEKDIKNGGNVILDYGFWSRKVRRQYNAWAKQLTDKVYFHDVRCDLALAKQRVCQRSKDANSLFIDEACFDDRLRLYEPITEDEGYQVITYSSV